MAFDALQQCFRAADIDALMSSTPQSIEWKQPLFLVIDPAAGGPQSDFALVSFFRHKGMFVVSAHTHTHTHTHTQQQQQQQQQQQCTFCYLKKTDQLESHDLIYSTFSFRSKSSIRIVSLMRN